MGWTTKGSGRRYESLSGIGTFFGYFNKKVLSFKNFNRKCKNCDNGVPISKHPAYKKNYEGTVKFMESQPAAQLVSENHIFDEYNVRIGLVGADNDSCTILAIRNAYDHEVVKHSDKNHTSKGVVNELFKMKKQFKELNSISISFVQKCFNYCVSQCGGDSETLSKSLKVVPYHCLTCMTIAEIGASST